MITLYTIECELANILIRKLRQKGIEFKIVNNVETFKQLRFDDVPILKIDDEILSFRKAIEWVDNK